MLKIDQKNDWSETLMKIESISQLQKLGQRLSQTGETAPVLSAPVPGVSHSLITACSSEYGCPTGN